LSEQQTQTTIATADVEQISRPDDSEPTPERQAELRKVYEANVAVGKPPYAGVVIGTRGELSWIMRERGWNEGGAAMRVDYRDLRDTDISADVSGIDLSFANLSRAFIDAASFSGADLGLANLSGAFIGEANFSGANLGLANLNGSYIFGASTGTNFSQANLSGATLSGAMITADFSGANLTRARMDASTVLGVSARGKHAGVRIAGTTRLLDVSWNGSILALVNWNEVPRLGDEEDIQTARTGTERVQAYRDAARAYYGLAKALETQGLTAPALRYRRRQHQLERAALLHEFKLGQWLFSSLLNLVSGYGDRPLRALGVYLAVVLSFAGVYFGITAPGSPIFFSGSQPLNLHEALVFSLSSFHGRGFFPQTISLGDPVATIAALEAIVGLFIELVLIATFTRRLFER